MLDGAGDDQASKKELAVNDRICSCAAGSDRHNDVLVCESGQRSPLLVSYIHRMCSQLHHLRGCSVLD